MVSGLILACLLLHGGGFLLGWLIPRLAGQSVQAQRTISIEVGMQNSGLAVVLARSGGFASPLTALPLSLIHISEPTRQP